MRRTFLTALLAAFLAGLPGCGDDGKDAKVPGSKPQAGPGQNSAKTGDENQRPRQTARAGTLDVSYVTPDFFAAMVVYPQRITGSPVLEGLPLEEPLAELRKNMGVDPRKVEQLVMLLQTPAAGTQPGKMPRPSAVVRFAEPIEAKALLEPMWGALEEKTDGAKVYYLAGRAGDLAACAADDRTLLISSEVMLRKMISGDGGKTPLADRLRGADGDADLVAVVTVAPVRRMIEQTAEEAKDEIPAELAPVAAMTEHVEVATLTVTLSGDPVARLELEASSAESVTKLEEMAQGLVAFAGILYTSRREEMLQQEPREASKAAVELFDEIRRGIKVSKEANRVVVTLKRPKGMDTLGKTLAAVAAGDAVTRTRQRAYLNAAEAQVAVLGTALELYRLDVGAYPTTEQGLEALRTPPADLASPDKWAGPYLKVAVPPDPWNRPYQYQRPGKHNPEKYDLWSQGPDAASADDDIGNWKQQPQPAPLDEGVY